MSLSNIVLDKKIKYLLVSFTDLLGVMRSKLVPTSAVKQLEQDGAAFAGFATHFDMSPADPDIVVRPDENSFTILPWKPEVAWITGDLEINGTILAQAPRNILAKGIKKAKSLGYTFKTGVEAEFFLLDHDGENISDLQDSQLKPCYDQLALMRRYELIKKICDSMQQLGWQPYQNDHEDASGQFEMNWSYDESMVTADRHAFFRFMVKTLAEQEGYKATFMPKPFQHLTGNGCHIHCSLWDITTQTNLFSSKHDKLGLSNIAYQFIAGILKNSKALCAITNPSINSYKRLHAKSTDSGATWSPSRISYSGNNRTHMIRVPDGNRFELRLADGAANPYLLQAGVLNAGLIGIEQSWTAGEHRDDNDYLATDQNSETLPYTLSEALEHLNINHLMTESLGTEFVLGYNTIKQEELVRYRSSISEWERKNTLDI